VNPNVIIPTYNAGSEECAPFLQLGNSIPKHSYRDIPIDPGDHRNNGKWRSSVKTLYRRQRPLKSFVQHVSVYHAFLLEHSFSGLLLQALAFILSEAICNADDCFPVRFRLK
jgi:hypothetical protein